MEIEENRKLNKVILYQAYGSPEIYKQVIFSLLTLHYHLAGNFNSLSIVIYTDRPAVFRRYAEEMPIILERLNQQQINSYKGENHFIHRVKICIMQDCFQKFKKDILYLDSDTYFTKAPTELLQQISPGTSVMNSNDYDLISADILYENIDWLAIRRVIRDHWYSIDGEMVKIPLSSRMWNAGVVGMGIQNEKLLQQVLDLSDQIYANKKVFTAEQFAFSYFLQSKTQLITSGDFIFHYWQNFQGCLMKPTYNYHINILLKKGRSLKLKEQALAAYHLSLNHSSLKLPEKTILDRILDRLRLIARVALKGKV